MSSSIQKDAIDEAQRIISAANERKIILRLLGGIAFALRSPSAKTERLKRHYVDIDVMGLRKQRKDINELFLELGYTPRTTFNAMNGHSRLIYNDIGNERRVDIFLNTFEMSHKFDFTDRMKLHNLTLPLADLLLTKLQVYEITEREYKDVIALLKDFNFGTNDDDPNAINAKYIAKLTSEDWGLWRTVTLNLERIENSLQTYVLNEEERSLVNAKIDELRRVIDAEPKSLGWKMRARVGERVKWYELPEADREVVDSRPAVERRAKAEPT